MMTTISGFGLGLRPRHYGAILRTNPRVDWFEALTENYMVPGGRPLHFLDRIRERYPIALHGVSLSLAGAAPLDRDHLGRPGSRQCYPNLRQRVPRH